MKKCPFCAEEIQDEAILCRYCKSRLDQKSETTQSEMIECPYCGEITKDSSVCVHCGEHIYPRKSSLSQSSQDPGVNKQSQNMTIDKQRKSNFWSIYRDGLIITTVLWIGRLLFASSSMEYGDILMGPIVILLANFVMGHPLIWLSRKIIKTNRIGSILLAFALPVIPVILITICLSSARYLNIINPQSPNPTKTHTTLPTKKPIPTITSIPAQTNEDLNIDLDSLPFMKDTKILDYCKENNIFKPTPIPENPPDFVWSAWIWEYECVKLLREEMSDR